MNQQCLECGEEFIGRVDKKFCSDYCRNTFNNKINKDTTNLIRNINNRLRKNWRILEQFNPDEKCKVSKKKLVDAGFDFEYFTSIYTTKASGNYYFCYNQGYKSITNDNYILVKRN